MGKEKSFNLVRSDSEIEYLIMALRARFMYTSIALSNDKDFNLNYLYSMAEAEPGSDIMASRFFGRRDN